MKVLSSVLVCLSLFVFVRFQELVFYDHKNCDRCTLQEDRATPKLANTDYDVCARNVLKCLSFIRMDGYCIAIFGSPLPGPLKTHYVTLFYRRKKCCMSWQIFL